MSDQEKIDDASSLPSNSAGDIDNRPNDAEPQPAGGDEAEIHRLTARIAELELEKETAELAARQATQALTLTRRQFVRSLDRQASAREA